MGEPDGSDTAVKAISRRPLDLPWLFAPMLLAARVLLADDIGRPAA